MKIESHTLFGTIEPFGFSPSNNFGCKAKSRVSVSVGNYTDSNETGWQSSTYRYARELLDQHNISRVIDFGTGTSVEFHKAFGDSTCVKHLVDFEDQREVIETGDEFHRVNFSSQLDLQKFTSCFLDNAPTVFVLADVIEHLQDPRPLLRILRKLLKRNKQNKLVMSTPDRDRMDGNGYLGLPSNPKHFREWTLNEISLGLKSSGFNVDLTANVPQNNFDEFNRSALLVLSCDNVSQAAFYKSSNLSPASRRLIITQEHASLSKSGGIGTYVSQIEQVFDVKPLLLFTGNYGFEDKSTEYLEDNQWFHTSHFSSDSVVDISDQVDYEGVLSAVEHLIFLYDEIRIVEYPDYIGLGYRVAQAGKANILPPEISTFCYCHGNTFYLDHAKGQLSSTRDLTIDVKERIGIELSSIVAFPSRFLEDLYTNKLGLKIEKSIILPYPISLNSISVKSIDYRQVDTIIFYGRPTPQKGFDLFLESINILDTKHPALMKKIKKIVLAGISPNDLPIEFKRDSRIEAQSGNQIWAKSLLKKFAANGIVVLPYRGDNRPLSIYEAVEAGIRFTSVNAGGIPEMIPEELQSLILSTIEPVDIARLISEALAESAYSRFELAQMCHGQISNNLRTNLEDYRNANTQLEERPLDESNSRLPGLTVVVSNYNGVLQQIEDALYGAINLTYSDVTVILADDGSTQGHLGSLKQLLEKPLYTTVSLIESPINVGLPGIRNLALSKVESEYVMFLDNDNVVHNEFARSAIEMLESDPNLACVTSWMDTFDEDSDWNQEQPTGTYQYRPVGADIGTGFLKNDFGDASAVYRVESLRKVGGWDSSSRSKWEDWQLFINFTLLGFNVGMIPKVMISYRVRAQSMARTYADFPAWLRIASSLPVPSNQRYSMLRALHLRPLIGNKENLGLLSQTPQFSHHPEELVAVAQKFESENAQLRFEIDQIITSTSWKLIQFSIYRIKRQRLVYWVAKKTIHVLIKLRRKFKT
jgi:glycosyltransferase involved in cell wall biosynthesis/GT2 family glycosyltransferase